jgi:predicted PurR-regulated permease PerM
MNRSLDWQILRYVGYALVFLCGAYLLYLVRGVLPLFLVAGLLSYAMEPVLQRLEQRGYSRRAAVFLVFLIFLLLFVCGLSLLASAWQQAQTLGQNLPTYQRQLMHYTEGLQQRLDQSRLPPDIKKSVVEAFADAQQRAPTYIASRVQDVLAWTFSSLGYIVLLIIVLPIITLWLMMEMNPLRARLLMLVPPIYRRDVTEIGQSINQLLGRYVRGQMIVCSLFSLLCTVAFHILSFRYGMSYPLVLGLMAGFLYIVPYLGMATIATATGLTAYFTSSAPVPCTLLAVGCCLVFNLVIDYGISPRVLGKGVGLHPVLVIFALLAGAQLGGILGMILAVPVFASLRVVLIYLFPQLTVPIPTTSPESKESRDEDVTRRIVEETREAEAVAQPLANSRP